MTSEVLLDASAALADIYGEPGRELVRAHAGRSAMSAVNFAEVISKVRRLGVPEAQTEFLAEQLGFEVLDADKRRAAEAGALHSPHRSGVSLADRFCLALALELGLPVLTTDRQWASLDLGVEVRLIR
jgi:PIN domain nuclease of toxin-antitoxin system